MRYVERSTLGIVWTPQKRLLLGALVFLTVLVLLAGAASIPFRFESSSMLYKFGSAKTMLRTGKMLGIIAGVLLLLQLVWSARITFLDRVFGLNDLFRLHRLTGMTIAGCAVIHPMLVYLPDNTLLIPLTMRYWPELVGLGLLACILGMAVASTFRVGLRLPYEGWRIVHRVGAVVVTAGLVIHVLNVSDSFGRGLPRTLVYWAIGLWVLLYAFTTVHRLLTRIRPHLVEAVEPAGRGATSLRVKQRTDRTLRYAPGQFAFIRITSKGLRAEEHPFTIASSPTNPEGLEFVIRGCGDWSNNVGKVRPGDRIAIDGPYGLFTHLRCGGQPELVMIAGGIGITPMLSMLRHIADTDDNRRIILIWSNKTREHVIHDDEFQELESRLPGLRVHHVFTREADAGSAGGRLDLPALETLLADCGRDASVFVCGPPRMMTDMERMLRKAGFSRRRIFTERFSL